MSSGAIVVTGASGYIGSHVVSNLLARGREVRATVRDASDPDRVDHLLALPVSDGGSLEVVEMDLMDAGGVARAVEGCCEVIHTAAAVRITAKKPQSQIVDPSVIGTQNVLDAIDAAGCVERLVHTSSTAAIRPMKWQDGQTLTTETWADDATLEGNPYGLAKFTAERLVREWHSAKDPASRPRMVTINPCIVFGPPLSKKHLRGSVSFIMTLLRREIPFVIPMHVSIVDVRDVAEAHVRALTMGEDSGRYLVVSGQMWFRDIARALKAEHPDLRVPTRQIPYSLSLIVSLFHPRISLSWARAHLNKRLFWDATPAERDLGMEWRPPEEAVLGSVPPVIENGWI